MKYRNRTFIIIIAVIINLIHVKAQDSLYLVGTITGESYEKRITDVKGIGDVNGDGYDDFMITNRDNVIKLFLGSSTLDLMSDVAFHPPGNDTTTLIGISSDIGDVNNDGYNDFSIRGSFGMFPKGKVFLYLGGITIDTIPINEFYEPWIQDYFGLTVAGVGDINKDQYDDFVINSPYNWTDGRSYLYLFSGGDTITWEQSITFPNPDNTFGEDFFGWSFANVGDINQDKFDDLAISVPAFQSSNDTSYIYFYYGGNQMDTIVDMVLGVENYFAGIVKNGGDINGDAATDFFIGGRLYLGLDSLIILGTFNDNLETKFDINKDEYDDFVTGNTTYRNSSNIMVGGAFVYLGAENIDTIYKFKLEGENQWGEFSKEITTADINGDGFDELFVLAPAYPDYLNPLGQVYIYSYKKIVDVKEYNRNLPNNFKLYQNFPNPFNPVTKIQYAISSRQIVVLKIYDILGNEIVTLINEEKPTGKYNVEFDASKYKLSSGVYFCKLNIKGGESSRIKMVLIK